MLLLQLCLSPAQGFASAGCACTVYADLACFGLSAQVPRAAAMLLLAPGLSRAMAAAQHTLGLSSQRQARPVPANI